MEYGLHKPACGGRCLTTGSPCATEDSFAHVSFCMVFIPTGLWIGLVAPYLWEKWHAAIVAPALLCFLGSAGCLFGAFATEPGILPVVDAPLPAGAAPLGRPKKLVLLEGVQMDLQAKRAKMVRETENCVENFDHYCPVSTDEAQRTLGVPLLPTAC